MNIEHCIPFFSYIAEMFNFVDVRYMQDESEYHKIGRWQNIYRAGIGH